MYCPKCGTQLPDTAVACSNCGTRIGRRSYAKIAIVIALALVVIGVTGYVVNRQMKISALNAKLEEAVGRDAGYTETIIKVEAEASSMTFKELFDLCEKSIEGRTNLIVELRGLYPEIKSELKDNLIDFLNAENELIRKKSGFYRKQLAFSSSLDTYKDCYKDYLRSTYSYSFYRERYEDAKTEVRKAALEVVEYADGFITTYQTLVKQEADVRQTMDQSGLRFVGFFEKYQSTNLKLAEDAKTTASEIKI